MRAILLLVGVTQALRPTLPPRHKTALNAFTNPFAQRPDELQSWNPHETAPLFGECRRKLAACIIVGFEDFGGVATNAQRSGSRAPTAAAALVKKLFRVVAALPKAAYGLARWRRDGRWLDSSKWVREPEELEITTDDADEAAASLGTRYWRPTTPSAFAKCFAVRCRRTQADQSRIAFCASCGPTPNGGRRARRSARPSRPLFPP